MTEFLAKGIHLRILEIFKKNTEYSRKQIFSGNFRNTIFFLHRKKSKRRHYNFRSIARNSMISSSKVINFLLRN